MATVETKIRIDNVSHVVRANGALYVIDWAVDTADGVQGVDVPVVTGEDQQDYLQKWRDLGFKGIAPTYPTYQWRTAIIAAVNTLKGEQVPSPEWVLPQPAITQDVLDQYINEKMPPLHYAMCGCEDMPNYPNAWGGTE